MKDLVELKNDLQAFGPFFHEKGMREDIFFATDGDANRSFSVVVVAGYKDRRRNATQPAIAIFDNDNQCVVVEKIQPIRGLSDAHSVATMIALQTIATLDWSAFSDLCRRSATYRPGIVDLDETCDRPLPGDMDNQIKSLAESPEDSFPSELRAIHIDPSLPYTFPKSSRSEMIQDIITHPQKVTVSGLQISWNVQPEGNWNRTGRVPGRQSPNPDFDVDWVTAVKARVGLCRKAIRAALSAYVDAPFDLFEIDSEAKCHLSLSPMGDTILLESFSGVNMRFSSLGEMKKALNTLTDHQICLLWAALRTLDVDLDPKELKQDYAFYMHLERLRFETDPPSTYAA